MSFSPRPKYVANVLESIMNNYVLSRADLIEILNTYGIIHYMLTWEMMSKDVAPLRNLIYWIAAADEEDKDFVGSLLNAAIVRGNLDWVRWVLLHFRLDDEFEIEAMNQLEPAFIFNGFDGLSPAQKLFLSVMMKQRSWFPSLVQRWNAVVQLKLGM